MSSNVSTIKKVEKNVNDIQEDIEKIKQDIIQIKEDIGNFLKIRKDIRAIMLLMTVLYPYEFAKIEEIAKSEL
jgi:hypothetical protein